MDSPQPCHEDWRKITPKHKKKYYKVHKKTVLNFLNIDLLFSRKVTHRYLSYLNLFIFLVIISQYTYSQVQIKVAQLDTTLHKTSIQPNKNSKTDTKGNQIKGVVTDKSKTPLAGVTILIKGTTKGTVSNFTGNFFIKAEIGNILLINSIGYKPKEIKIDKELPEVILLELEEDIMVDVIELD